MKATNKEILEELYGLSQGLMFATPQCIIDDGADLLALLGVLTLQYQDKSDPSFAEIEALLNGIRIAEGLIRFGNGFAHREKGLS